MEQAKMRKIMLMQLDMPLHKILYFIGFPELVKGLWGCLNAYGVEYTPEAHALLVEVVQEKLEGPDMEREWTEREYESFVQYKPAGG